MWMRRSLLSREQRGIQRLHEGMHNEFVKIAREGRSQKRFYRCEEENFKLNPKLNVLHCERRHRQPEYSPHVENHQKLTEHKTNFSYDKQA